MALLTAAPTAAGPAPECGIYSQTVTSNYSSSIFAVDFGTVRNPVQVYRDDGWIIVKVESAITWDGGAKETKVYTYENARSIDFSYFKETSVDQITVTLE